jgi:enamine deaminase RidA (YjgF/YER057c/UK114 family)
VSIEERLRELDLTLPPAPRPVAAYVPWVRTGSLVFLSGIVPFRGDVPFRTGRLGETVNVEEGYEAARLAALASLAVLRDADLLERVRRVVRVTGYVASGPDFTDQPQVINGASEVLVAVFGEVGAHARSAIGVARLPLNSCVEVEFIYEVA